LSDGDIKYFDYYKRPKDISLDEYLKVYDAFCKAYGIRIDETDKHMFSRDVEKKILYRHMPESVDHRPILGGNKSGARLMVIPLKGYVRFHAYSYQGNPSVDKFIRLAKNSLHKSENLESKVK
jgi:hypothetical protein